MNPAPPSSAFNFPRREASTSQAALIFALAMGGFAIGTAEFAAMALVPYFSSDLGVNQARAADAISAYAVGVFTGAPILAIAGARLSQKRLLIILSLAFALFNGLSACAPTFPALIFLRFLSGLPHGAYFGVAALVATAQVEPARRSTALGRMSLGLTVATIVGVPAANLLGQTAGWRWGFAIVALLAAATAAAIHHCAGAIGPDRPTRLRDELRALTNRQVLLTLATGAVGFGGYFAVYTYIASTMSFEMRLAPGLVPLGLALVGVGMTGSAILSGWAADRSRSIAGMAFMGTGTIVMLLYPLTTHQGPIYMVGLFVLGMTGGLPNVLQSRLMDVAADSQKFAAALNQSAFNVANAVGPWIAASVIGRGAPFSSSGFVGAALTTGGMAIYGVAILDARRARTRATAQSA